METASTSHDSPQGEVLHQHRHHHHRMHIETDCDLATPGLSDDVVLGKEHKHEHSEQVDAATAAKVARVRASVIGSTTAINGECL